MSRMTSSICVNNMARQQQQAATAKQATTTTTTATTTTTKTAARATTSSTSSTIPECNQKIKVLTNFSIDSIIGQNLEQAGNSNKQSRLRTASSLSTSLPSSPVVELESSAPTASCRESASDRLVAPSKIVTMNTDDDQLPAYKVKINSTAQQANGHKSQVPGTNSQYKQQPSSSPPPPPPLNQIKKYRPKNFQCPACRMAFSNNGQLKNHVRIHTGERPFRCNQSDCGKTFTRNEELTRHRLIHTGVRPHECPHCGKGFGRKDHLKKHTKTHERKRLRKRVYVPSSRVTSSYLGNAHHDHDTYVTPKSTIKKVPTGTRLNRSYNHPSCAPVDSCLPRMMATYPDTNCTSAPMMNIMRYPAPDSQQAITFATTMLNNPIVSIAAAAVNSTTSIASTIQSMPSLETKPTIATGNDNNLQQLASDYWQKWYNFLGYYQQQQQQHQFCSPTNKLR